MLVVVGEVPFLRPGLLEQVGLTATRWWSVWSLYILMMMVVVDWAALAKCLSRKDLQTGRTSQHWLAKLDRFGRVTGLGCLLPSNIKSQRAEISLK